MKCINKRVMAGLCGLMLLIFNGCGQKIEFDNDYQLLRTTQNYNTAAKTAVQTTFFADQICVIDAENILDEAVTEDLSEAAGSFDLKEQKVVYAKNIYEKLYPASTTKILTAYTALKHGDLAAMATVSETAMDLPGDSSMCGLAVGDQLSLEQLLYGLLMESGNDAANVIAELISGSQADFAALMNEEAKKIGATQSNFVNPHGLHEEDHYTTLYDLYLIMNQAIQSDKFVEIINASSYLTNYKNSNGEAVEQEWLTTDAFLNGEQQVPEGISVIGGKTGTTNAAGSCLVLYSEEADQTPYISIVLKAETKENLYTQMTEILEKNTK